MRIVSVPAHFAGSYFRKLSFHPDGGRPQAGDVLLESNSNLHRGRAMKLHSSMLRNSLFLLAVILALPAVRAVAQSKQEASGTQQNQSKLQSGFKPLPRNEKGLEAAQEGPEFLRRRQEDRKSV